MRTFLPLFFIYYAFHTIHTKAPSLDISPEQQKILEDLSWPLKIQLYNEILDDKIKNEKLTPKSKTQKPQVKTQNPPIKTQKPPTATPKTRRVGVESRILSLRIHDLENDEKTQNDEEAMKVKLFRLMYEVVRDNELKVKRANLMKTTYKDNPDFYAGFLIGAVNDKYEAMLDIAKTLKKFHQKWLPIDHINAYEQISNQAVEIGNLIDMLRLLSDDKSTNSTSTDVYKYVQDMSR